MVEMGPSVLLGASSTFIGVLPMVFANSAIFRIFFKMFVAIVLFGVAHGLVLCPVLLSMFGPTTPPRLENTKNEQKHKGQVPFDESKWFSYLDIQRGADGSFGVKFKSISQDGSDTRHHVLVSGLVDTASPAQEGDLVISVKSPNTSASKISSLEALGEAVMGKEDARIRLRRRLYALTEVLQLRSQVQIFGLSQSSSQKYNYQIGQIVKELESWWITVMLVDPSFDRKLLLLSPLNLVPYVIESYETVTIAANT